MGAIKKIILPILIAGVWINISETIRWELIIKSYWIKHYEGLNLVFPNEPVNWITWMIWGFLFAIIVFVLSKKFSLIETTILTWVVLFAMLWIVLWNIGMLPSGMLWYVVPLSLFEAFIAALICKLIPRKSNGG